MNNFLDNAVVERYEKIFSQGYDHKYPNENIVRLVEWFFGKNSGGGGGDY